MTQRPKPNPTLDVGKDGIGRNVFDDPLRDVDQSGLSGLVARLNEFVHRFGPRFSSGPLLLDLARSGESFYSRFP